LCEKSHSTAGACAKIGVTLLVWVCARPDEQGGLQGIVGEAMMATFTSTVGLFGVADAKKGILKGFTGGTIAELQDPDGTPSTAAALAPTSSARAAVAT
jgi:hypothetical protein